jgi:hypothetical protein
MTSLVVYIFGMAIIGIGAYFLLRKSEVMTNTDKPNQSKTTLEEGPSETSFEISNNQNADSNVVLEEAIILAAEDGKLSNEEEKSLREKAKLIGKDPDELIQQLREDVFGLENGEETTIDPDFNPGLAFEKYVFQLLNPRFFRLDYWAGDKFLAGRYTSTDLAPDIQVTANTVEGRFPLAVECKWRAKQDGDYIWFAEDKQLERYQDFSRETGKPTFIVLGLGGEPQSPDEVYMIPIHTFKRGTLHRASLAHYRKPNPEVGFFFDPESSTLM